MWGEGKFNMDWHEGMPNQAKTCKFCFHWRLFYDTTGSVHEKSDEFVNVGCRQARSAQPKKIFQHIDSLGQQQGFVVHYNTMSFTCTYFSDSI